MICANLTRKKKHAGIFLPIYMKKSIHNAASSENLSGKLTNQDTSHSESLCLPWRWVAWLNFILLDHTNELASYVMCVFFFVFFGQPPSACYRVPVAMTTVVRRVGDPSDGRHNAKHVISVDEANIRARERTSLRGSQNDKMAIITNNHSFNCCHPSPSSTGSGPSVIIVDAGIRVGCSSVSANHSAYDDRDEIAHK